MVTDVQAKINVLGEKINGIAQSIIIAWKPMTLVLLVWWNMASDCGFFNSGNF